MKMLIYKKKLILCVVILCMWSLGYSQELSVATNALEWAATTPNISSGIALDKQLTLHIDLAYNPWELGGRDENKKIKHWVVQPELRRWLYEKYDGHFFGFHTQFIRYNIGGIKLPLGIYSATKEYRFDGYGIGFGLSYGYQWYLSPHWNLEAVFGFGYNYVNYDKYNCPKCGDLLEKGHSHYFGPTKIGVSIIYLFKSQK